MSKPTTEVKGRIRHTRSDVVFLTINWILLILCAIVLLYPLLLRLTGCISSRDLQWFRDSFCRRRKGSSG